MPKKQPITRAPGRPRKLKEPTHLTLRVERADRARWEQHAESRNQSLTDYINEAANSALHHNLHHPEFKLRKRFKVGSIENSKH